MEPQSKPKPNRYTLKGLFIFIAALALYMGGWQHGRSRNFVEHNKALMQRDIAEERFAELQIYLAEVQAELDKCKGTAPKRPERD
jgi:hypothetical protein